jgi:hypothetical protein
MVTPSTYLKGKNVTVKTANRLKIKEKICGYTGNTENGRSGGKSKFIFWGGEFSVTGVTKREPPIK